MIFSIEEKFEMIHSIEKNNPNFVVSMELTLLGPDKETEIITIECDKSKAIPGKQEPSTKEYGMMLIQTAFQSGRLYSYFGFMVADVDIENMHDNIYYITKIKVMGKENKISDWIEIKPKK